ncbi:SirB1 family protein [Pelomicrobium methylotrophicum]|uniref:Tetratricopeptide repeat protein n=1 Tax=Pelomicrobium methylotrophicum TaxID=2602750 RepID=A0A5C7EMF7_9PROT|nr:tetratricopeptide repeat protein [Pelomicrobium methylotrophicum]TXF12371.1 tetratricopeptide repeat protein [Pelomicrobium methylotrophicum]
MESVAFRRLEALLARGDDGYSLAEGALTVALEEYPDLEIPAWLARLDAMGRELQQELPADLGVEDALMALNSFLFERYGFHGNSQDYYDPRNSFIHEVLQRRVGIPITLSIVYIEVGRRIGLPLEGISFPGHFLVGCPLSGGKVVVDAYASGTVLDREDLESRLAGLYGQRVLERIDVTDLLEAATKRDILARLLRNLKVIYLQRQDLPRALSAIQRLLLIQPDAHLELRDRGLVYAQLECFRGALDDLNRYLAQAPEASDADQIRARVVDLQARVSGYN